MIPFALELVVAAIAAGVIGYHVARGGARVALGKLAQLLDENRALGTLAGAALFVTWFGGWTLVGAARLVREALAS